jgi:hypothetical protein
MQLIVSLQAVVLAAMTLLGKGERVPPSEPIAHAIAMAVAHDDEGHGLTGTAEGDAVLMAVYAFHESRFGWHWTGSDLEHSDCPEGDGGTSHGYWQIKARREISCSVDDAARLWLHFAHQSQHTCRTRPFDEQLSEVVSGSCGFGHVISRWRFRQVGPLLSEVMPNE